MASVKLFNLKNHNISWNVSFPSCEKKTLSISTNSMLVLMLTVIEYNLYVSVAGALQCIFKDVLFF